MDAQKATESAGILPIAIGVGAVAATIGLIFLLKK